MKAGGCLVRKKGFTGEGRGTERLVQEGCDDYSGLSTCLYLNQLKSKLLGTTVKDLLRLFKTRSVLNLGHTFRWQSTWETGRRDFAFRLLALPLAGKFIYPAAAAATTSTFFRILTQTEDQQLTRSPWEHRTRLWLQRWTSTRFSSFQTWDSLGLQEPYPIGSVSLENLTNTGKIESKCVRVIIVK